MSGGKVKRNIPVALIITIVFCLAAFVLLLWPGNQFFKDRQESFQTSTVLALIFVTAYYAWQTRQQAEVSRLMVEKMEQQRMDAVQPELVVCETSPNEGGAAIDFKEVLPVVGTIHLRESKIGVHNFGVGLARDIVSKVVVSGTASPGITLPPIAPEYWTRIDLSPHWTWLEDIRLQEQGGLPPNVCLELCYRDTFGQPHVTTLTLKHDDHKGGYFYSVESVQYSHGPSGDIQSATNHSPDGSRRITPRISI